MADRCLTPRFTPAMRLIQPLALAVFLSVACAATAWADVGPIPQWIWDSPWATPAPAGFETQVLVVSDLQRATLEVLADPGARIWIDETEIIAGGVREFRRWTRIDVTRWLPQGQHRLHLAAQGQVYAAGVCVRLRLDYDDGSRRTIVTDPTWHVVPPRDSAGARQFSDSTEPRTKRSAHSLGLVGIQPWGDPEGEEVDYHQWKKALGVQQAESAARVQVIPGFEVDLVTSAGSGESSWISLAFDPRGRLLIGKEGRDKHHGILRLKVPAADSDEEIRVESVQETLLEPRGMVFVGDDLYVNENNALSLVRLRDTTSDGAFNQRTIIKVSPGGVGHGRNNLTAGPDGRLYSIHGNDVQLPADFSPAKMLVPHLAYDRLRPCNWDGYLFDRQATLPAGHLVSTNHDGTDWQVVAVGLRNPYGIDFNTDGEAFTFDADNEGDLGTPWYRPTRINHLVTGADYGWRQGTAMRNDWYPDSAPSNLVVGKSSPTAIRFGTWSKFPPRYRNSLFFLDWSYGRIYTAELLPTGSSYVATAELFLEGRPLNVTDLAFGPDGHLYFTTGGRGTQSGLYRVRYVGPDSLVESPTPWQGNDRLVDFELIGRLATGRENAIRALRRRTETGAAGSLSMRELGRLLDAEDPWMRQAAMTLWMRSQQAQTEVPREPQPGDVVLADCDEIVALWLKSLKCETKRGQLSALLAAARVSSACERQSILDWMLKQDLIDLPIEERLLALRVMQLILIRWPDLPNARREQMVHQVFPVVRADEATPVNQLAFEILATLDAPPVETAFQLLTASLSRHQEETILWLFLLRDVKNGWTPATRTAYLQALRHAGTHFTGGRELPVALHGIASDFRSGLSDAELQEFAELLAPPPAPPAATTLVPQGPLVQEWKLVELEGSLAETGARDLARGQRVFAAANCGQCHRFAGTGRSVGPDLHRVSARFGRRDLLETILEPSKVIDDKYRDTTLLLRDGQLLTGRLLGGDAEHVLIATNPLSLLNADRVPRKEVESQQTSPVSPMPAGLLNSFTRDEILDLLAYLEANGQL